MLRSWETIARWVYRGKRVHLTVPLQVPIEITRITQCPITKSLIIRGIEANDPPWDSRLPTEFIQHDKHLL